MMFRRPTELSETFVEKALSFNGYTASANRDNMFGQRLGLNGQPWDGMFIEVVARECGMPIERMPSIIYSPVAMSHFMKTDRFHKTPQRGDIAFFEMSTVSDFGVPHVGIVTDASRHAIDGSFECVEGMTSSGQPKRLDGNESVQIRRRHATEVIGYGRPDFSSVASHSSALISQTDDKLPVVALAQLRNGVRHRNVEFIQLALHKVTGMSGYERGKFDGRTRIAYAKFQRMLGFPSSKATGTVDEVSLRQLATKSKNFTVK